MITWRRGVVTAARREWAGAVELDVTVAGTTVRALAYPRLTGRPEPGDQVLLNTAALDLGLGTGGYALVIAIPDRLPPDPARSGNLVKARYTPLQAIVAGADEQDSACHEILRSADDIEDIPVVIADLHSALPAVLAGFFAARDAHAGVQGSPPGSGTAGVRGSPPGSGTAGVRGSPPGSGIAGVRGSPPGSGTAGVRGSPPGSGTAPVAYLMLDGGALPAWFSRTTAALRDIGWLAGTVTVGQAFGGDLEAVTVHSGLLAARHVLGAELVVVAQGPGNLGTGTRWGFSGVACGEAVNAVAVLGGRPVASLRISDADPRERHRGISHHSLTAYGRVALARADVVVPDLPGEFGANVIAAAQPLGARHRLVRVSVAGLREVLGGCPVPLSTMGRGLAADLNYFLSAAAAGRHAAALLQD